MPPKKRGRFGYISTRGSAPDFPMCNVCECKACLGKSPHLCCLLENKPLPPMMDDNAELPSIVDDNIELPRTVDDLALLMKIEPNLNPTPDATKKGGRTKRTGMMSTGNR